MTSLRKHTLTVRRRPLGAYNTSGFYEVAGEVEIFTIKASVQPLTGQDTLLLPENLREKETKKIFTDSLLYGITQGSNQEADIVEIEGSDYRVINIYSWQNNLISHYKALLAKRTTNNNHPPIT